MTILHICSLNLSKANGVNVVVPQYVKEQSKIANLIMLNLDKDGFDTKEFSVYKGIEKIKEILKKQKIDIAIFHEIYYFSYVFVCTILKKNNIPYILVPHCSLCKEAQEQKKFIKKILNKMLFNYFINCSVAIQYLTETERIASSNFTKDYIISPNGVYMNEKHWKKQEREGMKIIFIGRYALYHKGIDKLVDACKIIKKEMEEKEIVIELYGTDFENNKKVLLEHIERYGLERILQVNAPIYGEEKNSRMLNADLFILTSRFEGQPIAVLEAMAIGLVPIVTKGTAFMELVEEKKCGFPAGDNAEEIAEAILNAFDEKEQLPQMSRNAIKVIQERYEWKKVTENLLAQYKNIIQKGKEI